MTSKSQCRIPSRRRSHLPGIAMALLCAVLLSMCPSCIKNDLPYPRIPQYITSISAVGESAAASIDTVSLVATVYLDETTDIRAVRFSEVAYTEGATADPDLLEGEYDLSVPLVVTLTRYQTYQWMVKAEQHIERYLTIDGQIGETVIDEVGHRIIVTVPDTYDLTELRLTSIRLGPPSITTLTPDLRPGLIDLSHPLRVTVRCFGRDEDWTIYCEKSEAVVTTTSVDAWSCVAWAYGVCPTDVTGGFEYREGGTEEWLKVSQSAVTQTQGAFSARIAHLKPLTTYEVRAVTSEGTGNVITVTTQATEILPDGSFDQWWLDGKVWCPWAEGATPFWGTGNKGAATLGQSNSTPTDDTVDGKGKAAKLETRFVGIGMFGKLAAGNIFAGEYVRTDGTNGVLAFGRPFTQRPTKLKGYMKYTTAPISSTTTGFEDLKGRPDTCTVWIALVDLPEPLEIRTDPKNRQLFDENASYVIAYGRLQSGSDVPEYTPFEIELEYRSTSRVPTYILCTGSASKYGDFFTGGNGAVLYLDDLKLEYDY